jgi:hypothetical protein
MWTLTGAALWPISKLVVLPPPDRLKDGAQFVLPPKGMNVVEILGEQHHHQYDTMWDIVIEQTNHWLEDEIRAELMVHYGAGAHALSTCVSPGRCFGKILD